MIYSDVRAPVPAQDSWQARAMRALDGAGVVGMFSIGGGTFVGGTGDRGEWSLYEILPTGPKQDPRPTYIVRWPAWHGTWKDKHHRTHTVPDTRTHMSLDGALKSIIEECEPVQVKERARLLAQGSKP